MKELHGSASATVPAGVEECAALLEAVDRYPSWYPAVVRRAEIVERDADGIPSKVRTTIHAAAGPLVRDFNMTMAVQVERPKLVKLARIRHDPSDHEQFEVTWRLEDRGAETRITVALDANLSVPRLVPLGGIGDSMARGFVEAAVAALR